jgi:hypothetical protein
VPSAVGVNNGRKPVGSKDNWPWHSKSSAMQENIHEQRNPWSEMRFRRIEFLARNAALLNPPNVRKRCQRDLLKPKYKEEYTVCHIWYQPNWNQIHSMSFWYSSEISRQWLTSPCEKGHWMGAEFLIKSTDSQSFSWSDRIYRLESGSISNFSCDSPRRRSFPAAEAIIADRVFKSSFFTMLDCSHFSSEDRCREGSLSEWYFQMKTKELCRDPKFFRNPSDRAHTTGSSMRYRFGKSCWPNGQGGMAKDQERDLETSMSRFINRLR